MRRKLSHRGNLEIHLKNQGSSDICMSLHTLQTIHKINDKIRSTRHYNFLKHIPIQKWDINRPHTSGHHPRGSESRLQQTEYHIWIIYTSLHRYCQQYQT